MPSHIREETPRSLGFRQPAEWTPHAATWAAWPFDHNEWRGHLAGARQEFTALVRAIARYEPVKLLVDADDTEAEREARHHLSELDNLTLLTVPLDDVWMRDSGPIFVTRNDGWVSFVHWAFNAWGKKFAWRRDDEVPEAIARWLDVDHFDQDVVLEGGSIDTDGHGTALTTRQCLLAPSRNPHLDGPALERVMHDYLGYERIVWLDQGLQGDHTDGHVDTIARFVNERMIVACISDDANDPNHDILRDNLAALRAARDAHGRPYDIVPIPIPQARWVADGERLPLTYVNFYITNGAVLVPQYGDAHDGRALDVLRELFRGREVVGLPSSHIITAGGSFHCLTQQQPSGTVWRRS